MRKLIVIAAMSLLASQAYAGGPRSLSLAATNASQITEQPAPTAATSSGGGARECPDGDHGPNFNVAGSNCHDNRDRSDRNSVHCCTSCQLERNGKAEASPAIHRGARDPRTAPARDLLVRGHSPHVRHCERSEEIQNLSAAAVWIASLRSQ